MCVTLCAGARDTKTLWKLTESLRLCNSRLCIMQQTPGGRVAVTLACVTPPPNSGVSHVASYLTKITKNFPRLVSSANNLDGVASEY